MPKLRGIIIPSRWDIQGNVVALAIATDMEEEYLIDESSPIGQLKAVLRKEVEVKGRLKHSSSPKKIIEIYEVTRIKR
jgi:hypothetical protein